MPTKNPTPKNPNPTIDIKPLQYYIDCFSTLNCNKQHGQVAPHKAILLLAIMDEVSRGYITNGFIPINDRLEQTFNRLWGVYVGVSPVFSPRISYPFFHLAFEPFWELMPKPGQRSRKEYNNSDQLRETYFGAKIPDELCEYMGYDDARLMLKRALLQKYLPGFSFGSLSEESITAKQLPDTTAGLIMKWIA